MLPTIRLNDGADSRSQSMLATLCLHDRMIGVDTTPSYSSIDYTNANALLEDLRKGSQEYLKEALGNR